ncbi:MAG TPA: tyrosine-type recombinase/integrase [Chitinophagales bacterium]|nr:tyrosine-type recombinase/integrase [Chitinophagales bacterium]
MLITDCITKFTQYLSGVERYSEHTIINYSSDLEAFHSFLVITYGEHRTENIQSLHTRTWVVSLLENKLSHRSLNRKITSLNSFFKYCRKMGFIAIDPMTKVKRFRQPKRLPAYVPESNMDSILSPVSGQEVTSYDELLLQTILTVFYACGLRRSELIALKDSDVDYSRQLLHVFGKGKKERLVPMPPDLIENIKEYQNCRDNEITRIDDTLFLRKNGKSLYPKLVYNLVSRTLSGIPNLEKHNPHLLRHTFATHLSDAGADINAIKMLLGHANLAATQVYMHNSPGRLKQIYKDAHPRAKD